MNEGARHLGLQVQELPLNEQAIINTFTNNQLIICSVRKGTFISTGHFIVLRGY